MTCGWLLCAASCLTQEGEEGGEVLGGSSMRLPGGEVVATCGELAAAASALAQLGRAALMDGSSERLGQEAIHMAVRLLHAIAMRLRAHDNGEGAAVLMVSVALVCIGVGAAVFMARFAFDFTESVDIMVRSAFDFIESADFMVSFASVFICMVSRPGRLRGIHRLHRHG